MKKSTLKNMTLLYVEDDEITREEVCFFLKRYVKNLIVAKNGKEGLELFKEHNPDMVLTDIQMPIMNGLQMSEEILKINSKAIIAITTAYSDSEYIIKALKLGIDKYILKPLNMKEIIAVIEKSLKETCLNPSTLEQEDYIQFILDCNPTFMFIMHSNEIKYANKKFLDFMGYENIDTLKKQVENIKLLFELENKNITTNWINYVLEHKDTAHLVSLKQEDLPQNSPRKFYVSHKEFPSMNKNVFIFVEKADKTP